MVERLHPDDRKWIEGLISASTSALSGQIDRSLARIAELTGEVSELKLAIGEMQAVNRSLQRQIEELKEDNEAHKAGTAKQFATVNNRIDDEAVCRDDLEQYGRRMSVRVQNVPVVDGEDDDRGLLLNTINGQLAQIGMIIKPEQIIRFHRSSKPKDSRDGGQVSQCLVKLRSWDKRAELHRANKKARDSKKSVRVYHDLTKRRLTVLNQARDILAGKASNDTFVYVDINSSLKLRVKARMYAFNTLDEFKVLCVQHLGS